jgi:proteic killer suppression protein
LELILDHLHAAAVIKDMDYPGSGLHKLEPRSTDMEKQVWAVTVSGNWRVTFKFYGGDAYIVCPFGAEPDQLIRSGSAPGASEKNRILPLLGIQNIPKKHIGRLD